MEQYEICGVKHETRFDLKALLTALSRLFIRPLISIPTILKAFMIFFGLSMGLSSCGFTPVYGEGSAAKEVLESVILEDPASRHEQVFLKAVEQRLPPPANPKYQIRYNLSLSYSGLDVSGASRVQVFGRVVSEFVDRNTSAVRSTFAVDAFAGYTTKGGFREVQQEDAENRLMQMLADRFITQLMIQSQVLVVNDS